MNRRWLAGAAAAALVTTWAGGRAHAVVLRYTPKAGAVHRYRVTAARALEATIEPLRDTSRTRIAFEVAVEVRCEQKVLAQTGEVTRVETRLLGGKGTTSMHGQTESIGIPTGRAVVELDRRARATRVVDTVLEGKEASRPPGPWAELLTKWSQCWAFPEGDLKVGDTWSDTFTIPLPAGLPRVSKMSIKSQLLQLTSLQGRQCAKIRTTFSGPLELEGSDMGPFGSVGPTTGNLRGDLTWHYDYENSILVAAEGSAHVDMSKFLQGPMGPGVPDHTQSTKMLMNVKVALAQ